MPTSKAAILAKYNLSTADLLAQGMEAEVYARGKDSVLKLYPHTVSIKNLRLLQAFYASVDRSALSYGLSDIRQIDDYGEYIVVVEPRLPGRPLTELQTTDNLKTLFLHYVSSVFELGRIGIPASATHYKLFDPAHLSQRSSGDWHHFLRRWLDAALITLAPCFQRDVNNFYGKLQHVHTLLAKPYGGPLRLIHGDIFPGNMLADDRGNILSLLDFGLFTMYGDSLWDAATAWVFFDMYDELGIDARAQLLPLFLQQLGEQARGTLYRYVLLYSMLSANTYAADCSDGHYRWCVANLNTEALWRDI